MLPRVEWHFTKSCLIDVIKSIVIFHQELTDCCCQEYFGVDWSTNGVWHMGCGSLFSHLLAAWTTSVTCSSWCISDVAVKHRTTHQTTTSSLEQCHRGWNRQVSWSTTSFVRLNYCNFVLHCTSSSNIYKLQWVQNSVARNKTTAIEPHYTSSCIRSPLTTSSVPHPI